MRPARECASSHDRRDKKVGLSNATRITNLQLCLTTPLFDCIVLFVLLGSGLLSANANLKFSLPMNSRCLTLAISAALFWNTWPPLPQCITTDWKLYLPRSERSTISLCQTTCGGWEAMDAGSILMFYRGSFAPLR